jgi:hypothetical protein
MVRSSRLCLERSRAKVAHLCADQSRTSRRSHFGNGHIRREPGRLGSLRPRWPRCFDGPRSLDRRQKSDRGSGRASDECEPRGKGATLARAEIKKHLEEIRMTPQYAEGRLRYLAEGAWNLLGNRDRGSSRLLAPPTPPCRRVRIRRFSELSPRGPEVRFVVRHKGFAALQVSVSAAPSSEPTKLSRS